MEKGNRSASTLIGLYRFQPPNILLAYYLLIRSFEHLPDPPSIKRSSDVAKWGVGILGKKIPRRKYEMVKYENKNDRNKAKKKKSMKKIMQIINLYHIYRLLYYYKFYQCFKIKKILFIVQKIFWITFDTRIRVNYRKNSVFEKIHDSSIRD